MTTGVSVTINGRPIATSWDGTDLIALHDLTIRWGREDPYEQPEPSILTMSIIDRLGNFVTDENRVGQEVVVRMTDPARRQFRGSLSQPKARRQRVYNRFTKRREVVWIVTFTASDVLANLAAAVFAGDAIDGWIEGAGGWSEAFTDARLQRLYDRGASGLVESIDTLPQIMPPNVTRILHGQSAKDARTALELIQQAYRLHPLGVANYDPHTNGINVGQLATASPVALALKAGTIVLQLSAGLVVPASKIAVDDYTLESTVAQSIDVVQVSYYWYGKDPSMTAGSQKRTIYTQGFIEGRTTRYDPKSRRVLRYDTEDITFDPGEYPGTDVSPYNRFPAWLLGQVLAMVNGLNGKMRLPKLTFDARRRPLPPEIEAVIYRPTMQTIPLHFAGSVYAGMANVGPQFQIIGGTLRYDGGWSHEVTVSAALPNPGATLTLAQLVTDPGPTMADFDPDISLADLGLVTTGLA